MSDKLEPLEPGEGMALYIESREDELAERTIELHERQLQSFVEWLSEQEIRNMNEVTARTVHRYRLAIKSGWKQSTVSIYLSTVRQFIEFCESIDGVARGVADKIEVPPKNADACDEKLESDDADKVLAYLRKYHYASRTHALLLLMWHTGLRTGTIHGLDVSDFDRDRERLRIRHRPDTGTPLKNRERAERYVTLSPEVTDVIGDYIDHNRNDVTDAHGRSPLFTTKKGRPTKNSLRRNIAAVTRPCKTGRGCPHGRDPDSCEGAGSSNSASSCPSSVSGHPVRRGAITHFLRRDVPEKIVSDRMNVSTDVLEKHYDRRTETEKAEQRRSFLDNL